MGPVNDGAYDQPPRRPSLVARMATKTRTKVRNFKPYRTISQLPKLFRPDSISWARFDHDTNEFVNYPDQEARYGPTADTPGFGFPNEAAAYPATTQRKSSLKDGYLPSRLFSTPNYAKRHKQFQLKSSNASVKHANCIGRKDVNIDLKETELPDGISRISSDIAFSGADNYSKKKAEWEASLKGQEGDTIIDGFWEECKVEMDKTWQVFTGETTAHGYKRTMSLNRGTIGRVMWAVAIVGVSCIALTLLYNTVVGQDLNSFSSTIKSQPSVEMVFPAVTVCNLAPYDFTRINDTALREQPELVRQFLQKVSELQNLDVPPIDNRTLSLLEQFTTKHLHDLLGWRLENFIQRCTWNEAPVRCSEIFVQSKTVTEGCFTFNFDPSNLKSTNRVGSFSGLSLLIDVGEYNESLNRFPTGMKVLLHEPTDFPNTREQGMLVASGTTTYISIAKTEYKFLPKPFKAYGTAFCVDEPTRGHGRRHYNYTGYSGCMAECRLRAVLDKCGCWVYGRDPEIHHLPFCSMDNYTTCYIPTLRMTYMHTPNCKCSLPCRKVEYFSQMSSASLRRTAEEMRPFNRNGSVEDIANFVELKIFYKELLTHIEEHVALYSWFVIFGNVGGQLGLFTGASVLTVLEFLEFFALIIWLVVVATYRRFKVKWRSDTHHFTRPWRRETGHISGKWKPETGQNSRRWRPETGHNSHRWRPETGHINRTGTSETGHNNGTVTSETEIPQTSL